MPPQETARIYSFLDLGVTGLTVGAVLIAVHLFAFFRGEQVREWLVDFPRSANAGRILLAIDLAWAWVLISHMDLGEFYAMRGALQIGLPIAYIALIFYVDEFLAVRALGTFLLLLAAPVLDAAFLQPPVSRLLLPLLAYVWIVLGIFWVGLPYILRDQIAWLSANSRRWNAASIAGVVYGALIIVCALAFKW